MNMLNQLEEVLVDFGAALTRDNIEGLSFLMARLCNCAAPGSVLHKYVRQLVLKLQGGVSECWEGKQLSPVILL